MKIKTMIQSSVLSCALLNTILAFAETPTCPDSTLIRQSASQLNEAIVSDPSQPDHYFVLNENTVFTDASHHAWYVATYPIIATNQTEALALGQDNVANTGNFLYTQAVGKYYACFYRSKVAFVYVLTDVGQTESHQPLQYRP